MPLARFRCGVPRQPTLPRPPLPLFPAPLLHFPPRPLQVSTPSRLHLPLRRPTGTLKLEFGTSRKPGRFLRFHPLPSQRPTRHRQPRSGLPKSSRRPERDCAPVLLQVDLVDLKREVTPSPSPAPRSRCSSRNPLAFAQGFSVVLRSSLPAWRCGQKRATWESVTHSYNSTLRPSLASPSRRVRLSLLPAPWTTQLD